jgi:serine/threonine protein kinase
MIPLAPTFPGDSEIDTLFKIWHACGTPTPESWPGVDQLKDWHATFPQWPVPDDAKFCHALHIRPEHGLDEDGVDLLRQLLTLRPDHRISARQALQHPWFTKAKLNNMSQRAKTRLDAQAAEVAAAATSRAAQRKKETLSKQAAARAARQAAAAASSSQQHSGDPNVEDEEAAQEAEEEQFDEDIFPSSQEQQQHQQSVSHSHVEDEDADMGSTDHDEEEEEDEHNSSAASSASD